MNDDELAAALRDEAAQEDAEYAQWAAGEGRALLAPRADVMARVEAHALQAMKGSAPKKVVALRRVVPAVIAITLAAAAFALVPSRHATPAYGIEINEGAERSERGPADAPAPLVYRAGATFDVTLRPSTRVDGEIGVRAFFADRAGTASVDARPNSAGVVHVRGTWPPLDPPPRELIFVLAPPRDLPSEAPSTALGGASIVRVPVIAPRP